MALLATSLNSAAVLARSASTECTRSRSCSAGKTSAAINPTCSPSFVAYLHESIHHDETPHSCKTYAAIDPTCSPSFVAYLQEIQHSNLPMFCSPL